jgi:hypothetical protein
MLKRQSDFERQDRDFYPTPAWVTEALLLHWVRRPSGIWEPCCGDGSMARVLVAHGHDVVATDLEDRGYGEGGRDFLLEDRLPDGVTAIVTNPPYGRRGEKMLIKFIEHGLELLRPVGGTLVLLVPVQWAAGQEASELCQPTKPEHVATVVLADRINWIGIPAKNRGNHNHCWLVWDMSRPTDHARSLHVRNPEKAGRRRNSGKPRRRRVDAPEGAR